MLTKFKKERVVLLKPNKQKGAMLITVSFLLITLVGFAALAFDVGRVLIVRNELQNGADAAALAGANCLNKTTAGTDCTATTSPTLNWAMASTKATNSIGMNKSDNTALVDGTVQTGYWNVNPAVGSTTLQPTTLSPLGPCTVVAGVMTTACHKPAVMVTLNRATGNNGGPVVSLVATMFGGTATPIGAKAVAVISSPSTVQNNLIPVAINKCMYDLYWDYVTGSPKLATSTSLNGVPQVIGTPWELRIGSAYHYGTCTSGQWTSFDQDINSASGIKNLIENGNPTPMAIGDNTWIEPGTKTANYNDLDAKYPTPSGPYPLSPINDVTVIVVDLATDLTSKGVAPIVAFAGFHIDDVQGGSDKYVQGHFVKATIPSSSGIGPGSGYAYTPPRLAQ